MLFSLAVGYALLACCWLCSSRLLLAVLFFLAVGCALLSAVACALLPAVGFALLPLDRSFVTLFS